ncbi:MAG: hypothetical protein GFH27_549319n59 [Chloroflexi bacterium AL-W]|nr:hypothetical protein [Chloroflexi bacterium AL-N1]NOK70605.1 hypothetical protein [Chloroflexi bacterium AL-N10]NOK77597.1 hypothetical protein [Chloroflexi bacterium AL-N5]NOK84448.1 hypothetical protein [Chloroflexi bacterium AL-W]NOK92337.1 hypothetical protein [Chloroflexi bacterium AL-N15]
MSEQIKQYLVKEVHNFGGFFGGDTVTFTAVPADAPDAEEELTVDEQAFSNVSDRYTITIGMLLEIKFVGARVEQATLLGATTHTELRAALGAVELDGPLDGLHILSHQREDGLWVAGEPKK